MNFSSISRIILVAILVLYIAVALPVSAVSSNENATALTSGKPTVSATVSSATPTVGDPVTISGIATGGNLSAGVQIWIFAGNYVNVTTVPVQADGAYTATYQTTGFPPAMYYVFVQAPGNDGTFNIELETSGQFSGQVVDAQSGALLFNFTGTGSVQDAAAASSLSDALNQRDVDDVYTKTTFQLMAPPTAAATVTESVTPLAATPVPTTKSPASPLTVFIGIGICSIAVSVLYRK